MSGRIGEMSPRRVFPRRGTRLDLGCITGEWWPTVHIDCAGVFCVAWNSPRGKTLYAALGDFSDAAQRELIAQCRAVDQRAREMEGAS